MELAERLLAPRCTGFHDARAHGVERLRLRHETTGAETPSQMLHPLLQDLVAAELPILAAHDVSMWGYVVLGALDRSPVRTQAALAEAIGADKTRIIGTLDELQRRGYIDRRPDPDDRRVRLLEITPAGRTAKDAVPGSPTRSL